MHRRALILTVAATGIAMPLALNRAAFAQSTSTGGSSSSSGSMKAMDSDDLKKMAAANGMASLQSSQLAAKQASSSMVKQFAELEAEEQQNIMAAMKAMGDNPSGASIPDDKKQAMQRLQSANGQEFDRLYVTNQLQAHQELLTLHQNLLQGTDKDSRDAVIPLLAVPSIKSHIAMLQMIQQDMGSPSASSR